MSRKRDQNPLMGRESSGPNWGRICAITLCIVLAIVGVGSAAIYYLGHNLISKTNYLADEDVRQVDTIPVEGMSEAEDADALKGIVLNQSEMESLHQQMNQVESIDTIMNEDVYNVILAGVDRRDKSWNGNSDSMMLVSINNEKNRVVVVSLMRDTYVEIKGGQVSIKAADEGIDGNDSFVMEEGTSPIIVPMMQFSKLQTLLLSPST